MKKTGKWEQYEAWQANRPGQAEPGATHWIVINLSRHKEHPLQRRVALFFRHPSEDAAIAEAVRLSEKFPGKRFAVYASGPSFKIEAPPEPEAAS